MKITGLVLKLMRRGGLLGACLHVLILGCVGGLLSPAFVSAQTEAVVVPPEVEEPEVEVPPVDPVKDPNGLREEASTRDLGSLKSLKVPLPSNLADFVKDEQAVKVLGKALFWDEQAGSDGMACASCHFHAGADPRAKNQLSPSFIGGNGVFDFLPSRPDSGGPNYTLKRKDFPFHQKVDPTQDDLGKNVLFDTDDVASSGGVLDVAFLGLGTQTFPRRLVLKPTMDLFVIQEMVRKSLKPAKSPLAILNLNSKVANNLNASYAYEILAVEEVDPLGFFIDYNKRSLNTRRVEPRNTPTVINAVFNHRNFWDGRANFHFNGRNPFGPRDADAKVFRHKDGVLDETAISLDFASLASQAVGPAESTVEMAAHGRDFLQLGRKLLNTVPLRDQLVAANDSLLGPSSKSKPGQPKTGLKVNYDKLIQAAFKNPWWNAPGQPIQIDGIAYSQMEANFSLYWGIAIMMYESTLVSDETPFDKFMEGDNNALTAQERTGLSLFLHQGQCANCHKGPEFTGATVSEILGRHGNSSSSPELIERMLMGDKQPAIYDNGFYNINVRPVVEDIGVGGTDPFGNPLSFSVQAVTGPVVDEVTSFADPSKFEVNPGVPPQPGERVAVMGAFKTPGLRNVDLTGPYFHNGGQLTLEQVVQFYARGTDFRKLNKRESFPFDPDVDGIKEINGDRQKVRAIAAFLRTLTDPRVAYDRAPFDHPSLNLPVGHVGDPSTVSPDPKLPGAALTSFEQVPCVGAEGRKLPIEPFLGGSLVNNKKAATEDGLEQLDLVTKSLETVTSPLK